MTPEPVSSEARSLIDAQLVQFEQAHGLRILFAVESGSRAWGFHSKDSDHDVRYVYVRPAARYVAVFPERDLIEGPADKNFDFVGWDLSKALGLMYKSNPCLFEWLASPLVYRQTGWGRVFAEMSRDFFSPLPAMHHYLSMARHNYREHMRDGAAPSVRLKKYLYICRPLLCCRWIEAQYPKTVPPPMPYLDLLEGDWSLAPNIRAHLQELMRRKQAGDELAEGEAVPELNNFIDGELSRLRRVADTLRPRDDFKQLDHARINRFLFDCAHGRENWGLEPTP